MSYQSTRSQETLPATAKIGGRSHSWRIPFRAWRAAERTGIIIINSHGEPILPYHFSDFYNTAASLSLREVGTVISYTRVYQQGEWLAGARQHLDIPPDGLQYSTADGFLCETLRQVIRFAIKNSEKLCGRKKPVIYLSGYSSGAGAAAAVAGEDEFKQYVKKVLLIAPRPNVTDRAMMDGLAKFDGELYLAAGEDDDGKNYVTRCKNWYKGKKENLYSELIFKCGHFFQGGINQKIREQLYFWAFEPEKSSPGLAGFYKRQSKMLQFSLRSFLYSPGDKTTGRSLSHHDIQYNYKNLLKPGDWTADIGCGLGCSLIGILKEVAFGKCVGCGKTYKLDTLERDTKCPCGERIKIGFAVGVDISDALLTRGEKELNSWFHGKKSACEDDSIKSGYFQKTICNPGNFYITRARSEAEIKGIYNDQLSPNENIPIFLYEADITEHWFRAHKGFFDVICSYQTLRYIPDVQHQLFYMMSKLRNGGRLAYTDIGPSYYLKLTEEGFNGLNRKNWLMRELQCRSAEPKRYSNNDDISLSKTGHAEVSAFLKHKGIEFRIINPIYYVGGGRGRSKKRLDVIHKRRSRYITRHTIAKSKVEPCEFEAAQGSSPGFVGFTFFKSSGYPPFLLRFYLTDDIEITPVKK